MIQAEIGHDAVDPGVEGAFEAKVANTFVRLQKCVLINILRFVLRSGQVHCQTQHRVIVVAHQLFECRAATALRLAHQERVVDTALT